MDDLVTRLRAVMPMRYLAIGLSGLTMAFIVAFLTTYLDPRTPWWGHLAFGAPIAPLLILFVLVARRYIHGGARNGSSARLLDVADQG